MDVTVGQIEVAEFKFVTGQNRRCVGDALVFCYNRDLIRRCSEEV